MNSRKNSSSSVKDGIDYEVLKSLPVSYHLILIKIYNEMINENDYSTTWIDTYIHFIPKLNGTGARPIALTSSLCKIFEIIITKRIQVWLEGNKLIPETQAGFRKGKSCADNLATLFLEVKNSFSENKDVVAAFIDVKSTFSSVKNDILLQKFSEVGCPIKIIRFFRFLIYQRNIFSEVSNDLPRKIYKGVLQGGSSSAIPYIFYVSKITLNLHQQVSVLQFANLE